MEIQKINELNDELSSILSKLDKLENLKDIIKNSDNSDVEIQIRVIKKEKNVFVESEYDNEILKITNKCHKDIKELISEHLGQLIFEKDQSIKNIISQLNDCTKIPEK